MIQILGGNVKEIPRNPDFSDDFSQISENINDDTSLIVLCSPNNPTGNLVNKNSLEQLLKNSNMDSRPSQTLLCKSKIKC